VGHRVRTYVVKLRMKRNVPMRILFRPSLLDLFMDFHGIGNGRFLNCCNDIRNRMQYLISSSIAIDPLLPIFVVLFPPQV
jgi:hypothetical protein